MTTSRLRRAGIALSIGILACASLMARESWPQFRGADGGVAADDPRLPDIWGPEQNVIWAIDIPGRAWSSPVVWENTVFLTTAINTAEPDTLLPVPAYTARSLGGTMTFRDIAQPAPHRWIVYAIDAGTGRIRWEREVGRAAPAHTRHLKNSYASETPVTDGERVYAYFGNLGLFALDMDGTLLWSQPARPYEMQTGFGPAKSPALDDQHVYIVNDNEEESFIAAYDKTTGAERWRVAREERSNWTTPYVWRNEVRTEVVTAATRSVRSYGTDGRLLWELTGMTTFAVPTPFASGGLLYVTSGYPTDNPRPAYAIRPGATGNISLEPGRTSNDFIVWSHPTLGAFHPSALVYAGCYYQLHDRGFLTCNDPKTGEEIYSRRRITDGTTFTASPWAYNGKVFALSEEGDTYVIQAGSDFDVLGKNSLDELTLATPAVASGSLFIRTASKLYRLGRVD